MSKKIIVSNLNDFFKKEISESAKLQGLLLTDDIIAYLSEVMNVVALGSQEIPVTKTVTLAELYMDAKSGESVYKFKRLGDTSVVRAGLFPGVRSRVMSREYYIDMGSSAYNFCYKKTGNKTYEKLSENIDKYCDIIYGAKSCAITNNILALYDDWKSTKSGFSKRRLIALGFSLGRMDDKEEEC
jgi:hypothetical protein